MKVHVLSGYDSVDLIDASNLKRLIAEKKVQAFKRVNGWVKPGIDPMRGEGGRDYDGPERRNIIQKTIAQEHLFHCVIAITGPKNDW